MQDVEFNLLDEPWIRVMKEDCTRTEVSLTDAILHAHRYRSLAGELPTQDIAVMRLMLAVLHTIFSRVDENGVDAPLEDRKKDTIRRWKALWDKGEFSETAVRSYLQQWHERFWLFHPERPFGQVAGLAIGTDYNAPKLNGEISESSNKIRLFSSYSGEEKNALTYAQAARWLLYLNAYDDTSSKPTKEGKVKNGGKLPSPGVGWLGKLGLIFLTGNNLFETLLLNLVMIQENQVQAVQKPLWECDVVPSAERVEIAVPDNLAALYTLQSRRILLIRNQDEVTGYRLLGGDFFQKENAFFEPMTVWRTPSKANEFYTPKRHDSTKQMWREFSTLYREEENHRAGVLNWYENYVYGQRLIPASCMLRTAIVSVEYGDKDFFVKNIFSDSLTMHAALLSEVGRDWRNDIMHEIQKCEELAGKTAFFARNLYIAEGGSDNDTQSAGEQAKAQLYYRLDVPFREWLRTIDPDDLDGKPEKIQAWQNAARQIAIRYAEECIENASESALVGHYIEGKDKKKPVLYAAPKAFSIFKSQVWKIYPYQKEGEE